MFIGSLWGFRNLFSEIGLQRLPSVGDYDSCIPSAQKQKTSFKDKLSDYSVFLPTKNSFYTLKHRSTK